jgi:NTP pyrophosphatase (non-canonical NTP hydrolase)
MTNLEFIRDRVPSLELLAQLAEEAMELGHAALKLRRALDWSNPTPVRSEDALAGFREEMADVLLCFQVLGYDRPTTAVLETIEAKLNRWASRLREREGDVAL